MTDETTFRAKVDPATERPTNEQEVVKQPDVAVARDSKIEPPYLDYETVHDNPFLVDYFELGDTWRERIGGFAKEVDAIQEHIKNKIENGTTDNSIEAVKGLIKNIEKMCTADKTERVTVKLAKMSAYAEFLNKTEYINKYASA